MEGSILYEIVQFAQVPGVMSLYHSRLRVIISDVLGHTHAVIDVRKKASSDPNEVPIRICLGLLKSKDFVVIFASEDAFVRATTTKWV